MRVCSACGAPFRGEGELCTFEGAALRDEPPSDLIVADRYRIEALIGAGSWGAVFRAVDQNTGRCVAIKTPYADIRKKDIERLDRERHALSRLHHPHIVALIDAGYLKGGLPFLVTELVSGPTLRALLRARGRLSHDEALTVTRQLLEGVQVAHAAGFVHRDLKPSNIVVTTLSSGLFVHILDFGLVAPAVRGPDDPDFTSTGGILGTPGYMAPEQMIFSSVDHRADLWAVGCLLREMLTGEPPPYTSPERPKHVDPGLWAWASDLMHPDPGHRPADAAQALMRLPSQPKPRFLAPALIAIAGAVLTCGFILFFASSESRSSSHQPPGQTEAPGEARLVLPVATATIATNPRLDRGVPMRPEAEPGGPRVPRKPAKTPMTFAKSPPVPSRSSTGLLSVVATEGGKSRPSRIRINGVDPGKTTPFQSSLPAGVYLVEIWDATAHQWRARTATIGPDQTYSWSVPLGL